MPSTSAEPDLEGRILRFFRRQRLSLSSSVLVAFSGGPDSRSLLELLAGMARVHSMSLHAAYLDHGLRPEAERREDLDLVGRVCASLGVPLHRSALAPGLLERRARESGRSLEELAREFRHRFLSRTADRLGCELIALGHTADDQAETLIMRFFQGAGVGGLAGIPERRGRLVRPLLGTRRAELLRYLERRGLEFRLDSSNLNPRFLRNAVRLRLVPVLEQLFPGFRRGLASCAALFSGLAPYLEAEAARILPWRRTGSGYRIAADSFQAAPAALRLLSLYPLLRALGARGGRIPARFLSPVVRQEALRGREVVLAGRGVRLRRAAADYILEKDIVGNGKKGYFIVVEPHRRCAVPEAGWSLSVGEGAAGEGELAVDLGSSPGPLVVRSGTSADRILKRGRSIGIAKLCSEWRLPLTERWKVPIVADRNGVLAVLGGVVGGRNHTASSPAEAARWVLAVEPIERVVEDL
jgi:tRNA(Ile)-lysidine synthase